MLKVKIAEKEFEYLDALETEEYYNGSYRRTLTITCKPDAIGLDELNSLLTEENLKVVTLTNTDVQVEGEESVQITNVHEGYVLKLSCGIKSVLSQVETPEMPSIYEDRIVFKLGKRTYIEEQLHKLGL